MKPYPIFLVGLEKKHCIVIGGTHEAEGKVKGLLECNAKLTVIAQILTPTLLDWAQEGRFRWIGRDYQPGDLAGAFFVLAERADPITNCHIWAEGLHENCLVNVMDVIPYCNFAAGSVIRQGPLTIAVSTSGAAPAFAVRMRQRMEKEFGPEYKTYLDWLQAMRNPMKQSFPTFAERKKKWYEVVDSEILELIREDRLEEARDLLQTISEVDVLPADVQEKRNLEVVG